MVITDTFFDERRRDFARPVAKIIALNTHTEQTSTTVVGAEKFVVNGVLKQLKTVAGNLGTDSDFTVTIKDQDGIVIWTSASIADNSTVITKLTEDLSPLLVSGDSGWFQITLTFTTSQTVTANFFKVLLYLSNH